jgi:uncharacterized protein YjbJ (UPF0337 family)
MDYKGGLKKRVGAIKEKVKKKHKNLNFMRGPNKI